jgi:hypothetical protein
MQVISRVIEINEVDNRSIFLVGEKASDCVSIMRDGGSKHNIVFNVDN